MLQGRGRAVPVHVHEAGQPELPGDGPGVELPPAAGDHRPAAHHHDGGHHSQARKVFNGMTK